MEAYDVPFKDFEFSRAVGRLTQLGRSTHPHKQLSATLAIFAETRQGVLSTRLGFFRTLDGEILEFSSRSDEPSLNLGHLGDCLFSVPFTEPSVQLQQLQTHCGRQRLHPELPRLHVIMPAVHAFGLHAPTNDPLWLSFSPAGDRTMLTIASALTGELLLFAPIPFALPIAALFSAMTIKIILLLIELLILKFSAPTGWGPALAALAIALTIIAILIEMYLARKAPPPLVPPAPGPGPGPGPMKPSTPYDKAKKKVEELQERMKRRAKDHNFDPFDPDYEEEKRLMDDLQRLIEESEGTAGATPEEKDQLQKELDKAKEQLPK